MKTNTELRRQGREALAGRWGTFVAATLLCYVINFFVQAPAQLSDFSRNVLMTGLGTNVTLYSSTGILSLLILPLSYGFDTIFLRNLRSEPVGVEHMFDGFRDYGRIFVTLLWQGVLTVLWMLLLIVPGIVKALAYALTPYILLDNPKLSTVEAIHLSREMMFGYKGKLFLLLLSFIGWGILCIFTCCIGFLWLSPYMQSSMAAFYEDVRADYETRKLSPQA